MDDTQGRVSDLVWRPGAGSNTIAFIDNEGHVSRWHDVISPEYAHPNDAPPAGSKAPSAALAETATKKKSRHDLDADDLDLGFDDNAIPPAAQDDGGLTDEDDFIEDDDDDGVYQSRYAKGLRDGSLPPALAGRRDGSIVVASSSSRSCMSQKTNLSISKTDIPLWQLPWSKVKKLSSQAPRLSKTSEDI